MELLPQTWIVLSVFIVIILTNVFMLIFNEKYRRAALKNSTYEKITYALNILVMAIVLAYSVQCSVHGSYVMPSCNTFSWVLTTLLIIMFLFNQISKIYLYVIKEDKNE